jgi:hypothetical protein
MNAKKSLPSQSPSSVLKTMETTKPSGKPTKLKVTKCTPKRGSKAPEIIQAVTEHPELTTREIGKLVNCDHSNVIRTLQRYGIEQRETEDYKNHRADILAGIQNRLLKSITEVDIKAMPVGQRLMGYGILFDKERLERNQSTGNFSVIVGALQDLQRLRSGSDD